MEKNQHHRIVKKVIDGIEIFEVDFEKATEDEYLHVTYLLRELAMEDVDVISFFAINAYKSPLSLKIIEDAKQQLINRDTSAIYGVYGVDQFKRAIAKAINFTNNKSLNLFDSREEVIDFLLLQANQIQNKLKPENA